MCVRICACMCEVGRTSSSELSAPPSMAILSAAPSASLALFFAMTDCSGSSSRVCCFWCELVGAHGWWRSPVRRTRGVYVFLLGCCRRFHELFRPGLGRKETYEKSAAFPPHSTRRRSKISAGSSRSGLSLIRWLTFLQSVSCVSWLGYCRSFCRMILSACFQ